VVYHDSYLKKLPKNPQSCSLESDVFVGWTDSPISGMTTEAPKVLYAEAADFPAINTNTKYYAVFAEKLTQELKEEIIQLNVDQSNPNWTLNNLATSSNTTIGNFWNLCKDASITSPAIDLQTLSSITMTLRSYYNYNTAVIAVDGNTIGEIVAQSNNMATYTWNATKQLSGTKSLQFTSKTSTTTRGVNVKDISIRLGGTQATYTKYLTHCENGTVTGIDNIVVDKNIRKIFHNGKLYILVNQQLYDTMGRALKQ
jgi:hypothetical protein